MNNGEMSFWDHLEELRWTVFRAAIALAVMMAGWFIALPHIFDSFVLGASDGSFFVYRWLDGLFSPDFHVDIININVTTPFFLHLSTSFWFALVTCFPYLMYEIWLFLKPALYPEEKRSARKAFGAGTVLFYIGCAVGYLIVFPLTFRFLTEYRLGDLFINRITLNSYLSNFLTITFMMGAVFEMPMLAWALSSLGILRRDFLKKYRSYAVVALLVLAAIITPTGDPFTLAVVFIPIYLLYELSILIVKK